MRLGKGGGDNAADLENDLRFIQDSGSDDSGSLLLSMCWKFFIFTSVFRLRQRAK
jgi:hypothetical protein